MLKNLLKYEFRATARTYGGIYLALLAAAGLIGFSLRGDRAAAQSHVFEIGVTIYSLLVMALVIVTIVTVIQRFTKNLLGREGYLMHTLPVTEAQLVGSKLISSAVWLLASAVVGVVSLVVMFCVGTDFTNLNFSNLWDDCVHVLQPLPALRQAHQHRAAEQVSGHGASRRRHAHASGSL